jgi:hypothetical protein
MQNKKTLPGSPEGIVHQVGFMYKIIQGAWLTKHIILYSRVTGPLLKFSQLEMGG